MEIEIGYCLNKYCENFNMYLRGSKPHSYSPAVVCKRCNEPLGMYDYEESLENQKLEKSPKYKIKGYRELIQDEINLMNKVK